MKNKKNASNVEALKPDEPEFPPEPTLEPSEEDSSSVTEDGEIEAQARAQPQPEPQPTPPTIEERITQLETNQQAFQEGVKDAFIKLKPLFDLAERVGKPATPSEEGGAFSSPPSSGLGGMANMVPMIMQLLGAGGGAEDAFTSQMRQKIMDAGLHSFTLTSRIGEQVLENVSKMMATTSGKAIMELANEDKT